MQESGQACPTTCGPAHRLSNAMESPRQAQVRSPRPVVPPPQPVAVPELAGPRLPAWL
jgi:hypothetical protein